MGAVQPAERAVPALLVAAGARPDELVPGDLVGYRLYILAWTYADIVLTAWLVGKASRSKKLGIACLCLLPMMFSVWQDSTGNSLYSYGALVQSTLLPALVAGLAVLRWQDTGHKRWAVLAGYCMFQCCATFEIGFTYIVPIFGLAWLYTDKARDALRLSIPALLGECVTLAFNMGARLMNTLRAAGILEGSVSQIEASPRTLICLPSCAPGPCRCRRASR